MLVVRLHVGLHRLRLLLAHAFRAAHGSILASLVRAHFDLTRPGISAFKDFIAFTAHAEPWAGFAGRRVVVNHFKDNDTGNGVAGLGYVLGDGLLFNFGHRASCENNRCCPASSFCVLRVVAACLA